MTLFDTETHEVIGDHQAPGTVYRHRLRSAGRLARRRGGQLGNGNAGDSRRGYRAGAQLDLACRRPEGSRPSASSSTLRTDEACSSPTPAVDYRRFLRRYDARRGTPLGKPVRVAAQLDDRRALMTPDGRLLVSTDRGVKAIDAETLRVIRRYPVCCGGRRQPRRAHRSRSRPPTGAFACSTSPPEGCGRCRRRGHLGARAFSPDGRTLSTAEDSGNVILWDVEEGVPTETLEGHVGTNETARLQP